MHEDTRGPNHRSADPKPTGPMMCSFCGKSQREVKKLIAGPSVFICDECIDLCAGIMREEIAKDVALPEHLGTSPQELVDRLSESVVGQFAAKRSLATVARNHYLRARSWRGKLPAISRTHLLLDGQIGAGKTSLMAALTSVLRLPFVNVHAAALTTASSVFRAVEHVAAALLEAAGNDLERASWGVVCIDDIDRLVGHDTGQQALLELLDGGRVWFQTPKHFDLHLANVLLVCTGTFSGPEGVRGSGLSPAIIARLHTVCRLDELSPATLQRILALPNNTCVDPIARAFAAEGAALMIHPDALAPLAEQAHARGVGAHGLRVVLADRLDDVLFDLPERGGAVKSCLITAAAVAGRERPHLLDAEGEPLPSRHRVLVRMCPEDTRRVDPLPELAALLKPHGITLRHEPHPSEETLGRALESAHLVLLLVGEAFLSSPTTAHELHSLDDARERGVAVLWVPLGSLGSVASTSLATLPAALPTGRALDRMTTRERETAWTEVVRRIVGELR